MTPFTRQFITTLDPQWREFWTERAAILEYECKLSREEAETLAWRETSMVMLKYRVAQMAQHQAAQPKHYHFIPKTVDTASLAAGGEA